MEDRSGLRRSKSESRSTDVAGMSSAERVGVGPSRRRDQSRDAGSNLGFLIGSGLWVRCNDPEMACSMRLRCGRLDRGGVASKASDY